MQCRLIDATAKGGHIALGAAAESGALRVWVRDDGVGIAPEHQASLFQPYFTTKKHGTGLGLFVTRKLLADHGGTVAFDSPPGGGTVFYVRLPATKERESVERPAAVGGGFLELLEQLLGLWQIDADGGSFELFERRPLQTGNGALVIVPGACVFDAHRRCRVAGTAVTNVRDGTPRVTGQPPAVEG